MRLLILGLVFGMVGCVSARNATQVSPSTAETIPQEASAVPSGAYQGVWRVVQIRPAANRALIPLFPGDQLVLAFDAEGRYSGQAGCNRIMGSVEALSSGGFRLSSPGITRMACPPPTNEYAFTHALGQVEVGMVDGTRMVLRLREGGEVVLRKQ